MNLILMIWVALTAVTGCAEEATSGSDAPAVCTPNETLECTCVDGEAGYQLCNEDGSGYAAPCECTGTDEGGDEDGGGPRWHRMRYLLD